MIVITTTMPTIMPITPPKLSSSPALVSVVEDKEIVGTGAPVGLVAVLEDVWGRITVGFVVKGLVSVAVVEAVGALGLVVSWGGGPVTGGGVGGGGGGGVGGGAVGGKIIVGGWVVSGPVDEKIVVSGG